MLNSYTQTYTNTEDSNNAIYHTFTSKVSNFAFLKEHRDYIEVNQLGFGERAFHYMWYLLIEEIIRTQLARNVLEIGVFKGQVISLWAMIARELNVELNIIGITPLEGNPLPKSSILKTLLFRFSSKFKGNISSGNFYQDEDYLMIIKNVFETFSLDFDAITLKKGFSTNPDILDSVKDSVYAIIYIDGDHTFEGVIKDIKNYAPLVQKKGFLVMDDASCNIPGTDYWKGHQSVSDACNIIESLGFTNVINIGHNRVYQKD